jgi:hypothetical protein
LPETTLLVHPDVGHGIREIRNINAVRRNGDYDTMPPVNSVPFPDIVIQPIGIVTDTAPTLLVSNVYTLTLEVSDGSSTKTGQVTIDLSTVCNSSSGNSNNPCSSTALNNNHIYYLPNGTLGSSYAALIVTSGGTPPYTWTLGGGSLPPGIVIDSAKGILKGTPTLSGTYSFLVLTTDSAGGSTSSEINAGVLAARFTITVQ